MKAKKLSAMTYEEFLTRVIDEGIEAAKADYNKPEQKNKLDGSIAGFEACRDKLPSELPEIWKEAGDYAMKNTNDPELYWWYRCYQLEVEWVINVVSCMLHIQGQPPLLSWLPTCNAMRKYASIVGVGLE